jgi:hypothetical protein
MDVLERIAAGLPCSVEELGAGGPRDTSELWLFARSYSRLRHKTHSDGERRQLETLKHHCIRAALAREPTLFIVVVDPGFSRHRLIYHRAERNLLHVPLTIDLGDATPSFVSRRRSRKRHANRRVKVRVQGGSRD